MSSKGGVVFLLSFLFWRYTTTQRELVPSHHPPPPGLITFLVCCPGAHRSRFWSPRLRPQDSTALTYWRGLAGIGKEEESAKALMTAHGSFVRANEVEIVVSVW
ncbi:hypothetical protein LZ30DRAFT_743732 [Colletotrichum cereale]|nr:hypothetical protein LZ30DRAFT_743732 [Colletotrichum cereale]